MCDELYSKNWFAKVIKESLWTSSGWSLRTCMFMKIDKTITCTNIPRWIIMARTSIVSCSDFWFYTLLYGGSRSHDQAEDNIHNWYQGMDITNTLWRFRPWYNISWDIYIHAYTYNPTTRLHRISGWLICNRKSGPRYSCLYYSQHIILQTRHVCISIAPIKVIKGRRTEKRQWYHYP